MNRIIAIAHNTFREAMRNKVLYTIVVFACLLILSAWAVGQLSLHEEIRVTRDLGLGGISLFGIVLAVFVGVNLVHKEIDRKTVYALIPKPIRRWEFIVGKFIGMLLTLAAQMLLMTLVLWLTLRVQGGSFDGIIVRALLLLFVQVLVVTAIAVFFSTFTTPFLSGLYTAGLFVIGRSLPDLQALVTAKIQWPPAQATVLTAMRALPDLHLFYISGAMVGDKQVSVNSSTFVDWSYVAWSSGYGTLYAICVLALAMLAFSKRDFV